jgi:hypothetical protein
MQDGYKNQTNKSCCEGDKKVRIIVCSTFKDFPTFTTFDS